VKPVLTADEYRRIDSAYDGDLIQAMDRAGYAVALAAVRAGVGYGSRVVVLAGPGNNGGDGYVAARYLKTRGASVEVRAFSPPRTREAIDAAAKARSVGVRIADFGAPGDEDVVIDALFGGGGRGELPDSITRWMDTDSRVVSVDYPTGLDPNTGNVENTAFRAVETITFGTLKTGHVRGQGPNFCGRVTPVDIGINGGEPSMFIAEPTDARRPQRERDAHKWSAGSVLVVGGSTGMIGAAAFAGRSALGFGAGSVVVASPNSGLVHQMAPQLPTLSIDDVAGRLDRFDVVVAGPGLAEDDAEALVPILRKAPRIVLDAGGLTPSLLSAATEGDADVVITPHLGELKRVSGGLGGGAYSTRAFATRHHITLLLKGSTTLITDGCPPILVETGGPELASIGTGDVLAGMIGALWARGLDPKTATVSGAYWHGVAGADLAQIGTVTADKLAYTVGGYAW
jgi:NAD(P)H-hydrate epimerase